MQKNCNKWNTSVSTIAYFLLETETKEIEVLWRNIGGEVIAILCEVELCFFPYLQSVNSTLTGVPNFLVSLGHTRRRRVILGHTLNIQTLTKTNKQKSHNVLSKSMIQCWAAFRHSWQQDKLIILHSSGELGALYIFNNESEVFVRLNLNSEKKKKTQKDPSMCETPEQMNHPHFLKSWSEQQTGTMNCCVELISLTFQ